jgi:hypothetical protein
MVTWFAYSLMLVSLIVVAIAWIVTLVRTGVLDIRWPR